MGTTELIAIVSLIISALTAGWTIRKDINDKGKFRLQLMYASSIDSFGSVEDNQLCLFITNIGNRDVVIRMIAGEQYENKINISNSFIFKLYRYYTNIFKINKGSDFFIKSTLSHTRVKDGDEESQQISDLKTLKKIKRLFVIDSRNNRYYVSDKDIVKAQQSYFKYLKNKR